MGDGSLKEIGRLKRHGHIRKKVTGSPQRPRLVVHRSHLHLYAQLVDDISRRTLVSFSTRQLKNGKELSSGGNVEAAKQLGSSLAKRAQEAGIKKVVFDRGGYPYHGRVKALADAARAQGLEF